MTKTRVAMRNGRNQILRCMLPGVIVLLLIVTPGVSYAENTRLAGGLMSVGNTGDWPGIIDVWVPNLEWRDLQPRPGVFRFGPINELIRRARASGDTLRLRIFAGRYAPGWVKQRFGTVSVYDPIDGITASVPRWWRAGYMDTYRRLQAELAGRYDGNSTIRAVTVSGAMTVWAEPFIRGTSSGITRNHLLSAGYSPRKDRRAIMASIEAQGPWHRTRQILAFNPWQFVRRDGTFGFSTGFTNRVMDRFRARFGGRAILQNNSLRASWILDFMPAGYDGMFRHMRALGGPISFQTAQTFRVGNLGVVLDWCLSQGAYGVEVHRGASSQLTTQQAKEYDSRLEVRT
jgi:hypothetical protein